MTTEKTLHLHHGDLPDNLMLVGDIAVDTEATGLSFTRDRLCLVQLQDEAGHCHLVKLSGQPPFHAPNLCRLLTDAGRVKIFHFARFDVAMFQKCFGITVAPLYCTKIASKLVRTYTDRHGLKELLREYREIDISKMQQSSDWAKDELSPAQMDYAATDVLYLHDLRDWLNNMLEREGRRELAEACFAFLPTRCALDLAGWPEVDIFAH